MDNVTASIASPDVHTERSVVVPHGPSHVSTQTHATENTVVIRDGVSLQRWRQQLRTLTSTRTLPAVQFQLDEFSCEQNQSFSALASGYQKACGCASGSFFMSVTVVAILISYFLSGNRDINLSYALSCVGITALGAVFGKLVGLLWARWRLLRLARTVHHKLVTSTGG